MNTDKEPSYYIHSKCCMAHWELCVANDGSLSLVCENCGKPAGIKIETVLSPNAIHCDMCEEENEHNEEE